jgi:hypothetical protein
MLLLKNESCILLLGEWFFKGLSRTFLNKIFEGISGEYSHLIGGYSK